MSVYDNIKHPELNYCCDNTDRTSEGSFWKDKKTFAVPNSIDLSKIFTEIKEGTGVIIDVFYDRQEASYKYAFAIDPKEDLQIIREGQERNNG